MFNPAPLTELHDGDLGFTETVRPNPVKRPPLTREQALAMAERDVGPQRHIPEAKRAMVRRARVRSYAAMLLEIDHSLCRVVG